MWFGPVQIGAQSGRSIASDPNWIQRFKRCTATPKAWSGTVMMRQNQGRRRSTQQSATPTITKKKGSPGVLSATEQYDQGTTKESPEAFRDGQLPKDDVELLVWAMIKGIGQATEWAETRTRGIMGFRAYAAVVIIGIGVLGMA